MMRSLVRTICVLKLSLYGYADSLISGFDRIPCHARGYHAEVQQIGGGGRIQQNTLM